MVKDYHFTNDETEILIDQAVQTNIIRSVLFSGKTSYRIVKPDSAGYVTILIPDTQMAKEEDDITANAIIHNKPADTCQRGKQQQTLQQIKMKQMI